MKAKRITHDLVRSQKWKPEPHTVALADDGEWWGLFDGDNLVSVLCVSDKHGGKYFSENYTAPEYRNKGYFCMLLNYVANVVYAGHKCIAHCLMASYNCYMLVGFKYQKTRYFKHVTQLYMIKEAEDHGTTQN